MGISLLCLRGRGGGGNIIACRLHICFDGLLHEPYNRVEPVNGAQYKHQQAYDIVASLKMHELVANGGDAAGRDGPKGIWAGSTWEGRKR